MKATFLYAAALAMALPPAVLAKSSSTARIPDCPLGSQAYSSHTMLSDLMRDARAKAILLRDAPTLTAEFGGGPFPPGLDRILTPAVLIHAVPDRATVIAKLDRDLAAVPIDASTKAARCAGYDIRPPTLPAIIRRPAVLVFDKVTGFRDEESIAAASHALREIAARRGWTLVATDNGAVFNARDLDRFDAVVWNNVSGDALTIAQRVAFRRWIERGGGYAGIHGSGGDPAQFWDWYYDKLVGARFIGHPMNPQFQAAEIHVDDPRSAITHGLGTGWTMTDEWYSFAASPRRSGAHVLATLDEKTYRPRDMMGGDIAMGDHPIAWTRCVGDGRSFYTAVGHTPESYREAHAALLLERGIAWTMREGSTRCRNGVEINTIRKVDR